MDILLIEDEPDLRVATGSALKLCGHEVRGAADGVEALAAVNAARPDLVVLDLHMPEMDGWEFLRIFRSLPGCAAIPTVVMSAAHQVAVDELDIQAFFEKPFDLEAFLDVIDELLAPQRNSSAAHAGPANERACAWK
jgi:CheY-like chemotaxis protein